VLWDARQVGTDHRAPGYRTRGFPHTDALSYRTMSREACYRTYPDWFGVLSDASVNRVLSDTPRTPTHCYRTFDTLYLKTYNVHHHRIGVIGLSTNNVQRPIIIIACCVTYRTNRLSETYRTIQRTIRVIGLTMNREL